MNAGVRNVGSYVVLAVLLTACGGSSNKRGDTRRDTVGRNEADAGAGANRDGGTPDPASGETTSGGTESNETEPGAASGKPGDEPEVPLCERDARLGPSTVSRLTNDELNNSVAQLIPPTVTDVPWLPSRRTNEVALGVYSPTAIELADVATLAQAVANELASSHEAGSWLEGCDPVARGEDECRKVLLNPLVERILRRPLTEEDEAELLQTFELGKELGGTFTAGVRAVVEVTLQSPEFLYLIERGNGKREGAAVRLTGYETAARLAFLLTGAAPDAELYAEAAQGPMQRSTVEAHARRLLSDSNNQRFISRTLRNALLPLEPRAIPEWEWSFELAQASDEAALRFIESVTFQGPGTLDALLTQPTVWANGELAAFYGYSIAGRDWQEVTLDASRAAGIFTQPAFLASTPHIQSSAVMRGMYLLRNVLCFEPPAPPDVLVLPPQPSAGSTRREQLEAYTAPSPCFECHRYINPAGFAFEHYDTVGKWRDEDNGRPVDASGELLVSDARGPFANAVDLMHNIVETRAAQGCFVQRWLEHGLRRELTEADDCLKAELTNRFNDDRHIDELLVELAKTDRFRYRLAADLEQ